MARLEAWADTALKVVDEKGDSTARVRLVTSDGACWQTWDAPFGDVTEWVQQAETLISELSEDFTGEVQFVFVAESVSGTVRSQCPRRVNGKRQRKGAAGGSVFGDESPMAALQKMHDAQAKTVEKTLQSANVQLEVLTRTVETQARAHADLLDYVRTKHETEALEVQADQSVKEMVGQLLEQAPLLFELVKESRKKRSVPAQAAAQALAQVGDAAKEAVTSAAVQAVSNGAQKAAEAVLGSSKG